MQKAKEMGLTKQLQEHKEKLLPEKKSHLHLYRSRVPWQQMLQEAGYSTSPPGQKEELADTQNSSKPSALLYTIPSMELPNSQRHMRKFIYLLP